MRRSGRSLGDDIVRGMINLPRGMIYLPRTILGRISSLLRRRYQNHPQSINFPIQEPSNTSSSTIEEEWAFLTTLEQQYGTTHPFFYACRLKDAIKIAQDEHKFLFMYLHSPEHPFTPSFCRETICCEVVVQFLDSNFVCWGGVASRGEGLNMAATLRVSTFPFCAVIASTSGDHLAVLQQIEGPVSPAELVEILQKTTEEQGLAFGSDERAKQDLIKTREDRRIREEQDAAYNAALKADQEKERVQKKEKVSKQAIKVSSESSCPKAEASQVQILIRFPNGERKEHRLLCTDKIEMIFRYIDSLGLTEAGRYRLISNFPRKVYGVDQMGISLKEAGLHPKASLFLDLLH